jgi:hypothetical protein
LKNLVDRRIPKPIGEMCMHSIISPLHRIESKLLTSHQNLTWLNCCKPDLRTWNGLNHESWIFNGHWFYERRQAIKLWELVCWLLFHLICHLDYPRL